MRKILLIFILALSVLVTVSCKKENEKVLDLPDGYSCDAVSGGRADDNVNIKALRVSKTDSVTEIGVAFSSGSEFTNSGEIAITAVPTYIVEKQSSPYAIVVDLNGTAYTDYERTFKCPEEGDVIGVFFDEVEEKLYFQFKKDIAFNVKENGAELLIYASPMEKQHNSDEFAYYVTSNTYEYYSGGILKPENLYPTKTRTGEIIFISDEYESEKKANEKLEEMKKEYPLYERSFEVIAKYYDELPLHNSKRDNARTYTEIIIRKDNTPCVAEVYLPDGFYLASIEDGILYEKFVHGASGNHSEVYISRDGSCKRFLNFEFESIEKTMCSPDGKMLAVLENSTTGSHLYVFDLVSAEMLYDLSDAGFGKRISDFLWNELGTAIYAIGGTNEVKIRMYDFSITDETRRTSVVYDGDPDEGNLELYGGEIYFVSADMGDSVIYRLTPELGTTSKFCNGSSVKLHGKYAAISTAATVVQTNNYSFYITNTETGERADITSAFGVYEYVWSEDGKYLYYIENRHSGEDTGASSETTVDKDEYPYTLHRYNVAERLNEKLCDIKYYNRIETNSDGVMIMYYDDSTERILIAGTYVM